MSMQAYVDWVRNKALPFWLDHACDADGVFWEVLDLDGRPDPQADLRLRTGMRQVYVFAHAALLDLAPRSASLDLAVRIFDRLRQVAWAPDGRKGWVARFRRDGEILDDRHDLYDHAFVLHALASLRQATGDNRYDRFIDETLTVIDEGMAGLHGGWAESTQGELPRRQNPHMHFFEANLALYESTGEARHLARAGELFGLFRSRFIDQETGVLREFFGPTWNIGPDYQSERLEPGHMAEWVWLLRRFERSTGRRVDETCANLFDTALRIGLDANGFLVDEAEISGRSRSNSLRLWPQTEYLKALVVQSVATGNAELARKANLLADKMLNTYLTNVPDGCWRDRFDSNGVATATTIPASTLYHLLVPAIEIGFLEQSPLPQNGAHRHT